MADGTVNAQVTDSVTQAYVGVVGAAPSESAGLLDTLMAETIGMAMYNAVTTQHNAQMVSTASVTAACARMLKTPFAAPPVMVSPKPIVLAVTPAPVPMTADMQTLTVNGSGFKPNLSVTVIGPGNVVLTTLNGSVPITNASATSFSMTTDVFTAEGTYNLQVTNADGGASALFSITVESQAPTLTSITSASGSTTVYTVVGTGLQPGLTVKVGNAAGVAVTGVTLSALTATGFTITLGTAPAAGAYSLTATNPDGQAATELFVVA